MSDTRALLDSLGIMVIERPDVWNEKSRKVAEYVFCGRVLVIQEGLSEHDREDCYARAIQYECQGGPETHRLLQLERLERLEAQRGGQT